jgi:D-methionine transport system ATP-binding protein
MIEFKDLSVHFPTPQGVVRAVEDVSFSIEDGEVFGIVGSSGAGKSTLLRTINGLEKPSSGTVLVNGKSVGDLSSKNLRDLRTGIGMIFQHFNLALGKTVEANVAFPLRVAGKGRGEIRQRVGELLKLVDLEDKKDEYPSRLSGGQKQRVGIARALANDAHILLCDEPTSALDPDTAESILCLLERLSRELNITIVVITHELGVVKRICDRVAVMDRGRLVEIGSTYEVFTHPGEEFTQRLIESDEDFRLPEHETKDFLDRTRGDGYSAHILKLVYTGESATRPILNELSRRFPVEFNIIHGRIEYIQQRPKGTLYISLSGQNADFERALEFISASVQRVEQIA